MKILIAEDDLMSRTFLTAALKKKGRQVVAMVNGAEAWNAMQQPEPRLDILDWSQVEQYVSDHTETKFSHGVCPSCFERVMKQLDT